MRSILLGAAAVALTGCAYVTATPVNGNANVKGIRVYSPQPYVVVNGQGVSTIVLPDCSREHALNFGTVLAKNDVSITLENGMLGKLDSKQDSTVIGTNFLTAVTEAVKAGKSLGTAFSAKAEGGTDKLTVYEATCEGTGASKKLVLRKADAIPSSDVRSMQIVAPGDAGDHADGGVPITK